MPATYYVTSETTHFFRSRLIVALLLLSSVHLQAYSTPALQIVEGQNLNLAVAVKKVSAPWMQPPSEQLSGPALPIAPPTPAIDAKVNFDSVILGLVLCIIAAHADELLVIKDSEAAQYVGKKVEVRGLVGSATTSPLGTTFINFGREYPNQIVAGYIPAVSKRATVRRAATLQGKIIGITGTVELYKGKPEIKVLSMTQIKGADSQP